MKEDAVDDKGDIWGMLAQNRNKVLSKNVKQVFEIVFTGANPRRKQADPAPFENPLYEQMKARKW